MICCDSCEDWFHGKCVNITKAMGQQMEEQGIEWTCPNCIKKASSTIKTPKGPRKVNVFLSNLSHFSDSLQMCHNLSPESVSFIVIIFYLIIALSILYVSRRVGKNCTYLLGSLASNPMSI